MVHGGNVKDIKILEHLNYLIECKYILNLKIQRPYLRCFLILEIYCKEVLLGLGCKRSPGMRLQRRL